MITYHCKILSITPYVQTEADGDELLLKLNRVKIWPLDKPFHHVSEGSIPINLDLPLSTLGHKLQLELWEYDVFFWKSQIGSFILVADEVGGPFITDLSGNKKSHAKYSLTWEVSMHRTPAEDAKRPINIPSVPKGSSIL